MLLLLLLGAGCADAGLEDALRPGTRLATEFVLGPAHTYPLEPMSPTSTRCAIRLVHEPSGAWVDAFVEPGTTAGFDNGDVHLPDGTRHRDPPLPLRAGFRVAWARLHGLVRGRPAGDLMRACIALDASRPSPLRSLLPGLIGLVLLVLALWSRGWRHDRVLLAPGIVLIAAAAWPVVGGDSYGTQEIQRLFSALEPVGAIARGLHGDARHPAGLFLLYAPVARIAGSVQALRAFGMAVLSSVILAWALVRFRREPGLAMAGVALLLHPAYLDGAAEVGPFSFYAAGILGLLLAAWRERPVGRWAFVAGLCCQAFLAAVNHVAVVVGALLMLAALLRHARSTPRRILLLRAGAVVLVALPFAIAMLGPLGAETAYRDAAAAAPLLSWGERGPVLLGHGLLASAFPGPFLWLAAILPVALLARARQAWIDLAILAVLSLALLMALLALSPVLRVQPYYGLYAVPLVLLALGRLVDGVDDRELGRGLAGGLVVYMAWACLPLVPVLARSEPDRNLPVARRIVDRSADCPVLLAATHDQVLPVLVHLEDPRRIARIEKDGTWGPQARRRPLVAPRLDVVTLHARHVLPDDPGGDLVRTLEGPMCGECTQVLYDRGFPLPAAYEYLASRCVSQEETTDLQLFVCSGGPVQ
jgi:hypothetical protein